MKAGRRAAAAAGVAALLLAGLIAVFLWRRAPPEGRILVRPPDQVEFTATVHARPFDSGWFMPGYHAVVWRGGTAAHAALLRADVSDRSVLRALESLGARPARDLPMEAWDERKNPGSPAPDLAAEGLAVEVWLRLPGRPDLVPLSSVVEDRAGRGLDLRFVGNEANIPRWRSGCIVCLYSCPGSKIGNAKYTERDYAKEATRFRARPAVLPPDGTRVGIVLELRRRSG